MAQVTHTLLEPFLLRCIGRRNDYAIQQTDGRYRRAGYALSEHTLFLHLQGIHTIGTYVIDEYGRCSFAVYDSDDLTDLSTLALLQQTLTGAGVPSYLELSRRAGHLWVFLSEPLPPALVRAYLLPFCPAGVEFYPKQDMLSVDVPYGSSIRVPCGVHLRSFQRYPFVQLIDGHPVPYASSVLELLPMFSTFERVHLPSRLPAPMPVSSPAQQHYTHIPFKTSSGTAPSAPASIREWCMQQDPVALIGRYVDLSASGLGCCPFGSHHTNGVDTHPSLYVYRPTLPDLCCWYCHTWKQGGSLFDFFRVYYGLEARDLWQRIVSGAQF